MHILGQYLHREIAARGWTPAEFARRAGLSRQNVYQLLDDDREHLGRLPEENTAGKLADALRVPVEVIWLRALESLGIPIPTGSMFKEGSATEREEVLDLLATGEDVIPDEVLLELVRKRLDKPDANVRLDELVELRGMKARLEALLAAMDPGSTVTRDMVERVYGHPTINGPVVDDA